VFKEMMEQIEEFLENTPKDIYEFSSILEDMLVDDYDEMYEEQSEAMELLASNVPYICATAEPGMNRLKLKHLRVESVRERVPES